MALNSITLESGSVATLLAYAQSSLASYSGSGSLRGYLFNAGKKKCWIHTGMDQDSFSATDIQRQNVIGILPGMAVPLPDGNRGFTFLVESGHTTLYWFPGDKPPVFSMSMPMGSDGLYVEDVKARGAIDEALAKLDEIKEALASVEIGV